jgi:hypothetical protein
VGELLKALVVEFAVIRGGPLKAAVVGYAAVTQAGLWPSLPFLCRYATHHVFKRQRALLFINR